MHEVEQGFAASTPPQGALSEAVRIFYEPDDISLRSLIAAHLHTHSSTSEHPMRHKYRSAVYVTSEEQGARVRQLLEELQAQWEEPLVTQVLELARFELNEPRYHDYYLTRPDAPFCRTHIEPKLAALRELFVSQYAEPDEKG